MVGDILSGQFNYDPTVTVMASSGRDVWDEFQKYNGTLRGSDLSLGHHQTLMKSLCVAFHLVSNMIQNKLLFLSSIVLAWKTIISYDDIIRESPQCERGTETVGRHSDSTGPSCSTMDVKYPSS